MTLDAYLNRYTGKRAAVIGIGVSNRPLIELLLAHGIAVTVRDKKERAAMEALAEELESQGCRMRLGTGYLDDITEDVIFRSPGIRPDRPEFFEALEKGSVLTSEMEAFSEVCPCPVIGETGSDGKTTTSTIISLLLKSTGKRVWLGGNIGHPLLAEADKMSPSDIVVLELSSFQLMTMEKSPRIAVITNLSPNHLDWHRGYNEYITAKSNLFTHQDAQGLAVFNADDPDSQVCASHAKGSVRLFSRRQRVENGVFCEDDVIFAARNGEVSKIMNASDIFLPGVHNIENYMAAFAAVMDLVPRDVLEQVACTFGGVEHRIELVRTRNGVRWYNDSIASSPSRTIAGLRSFPEKVILIAGGKEKGVPYDELGPVINERVKLLILCGLNAETIRRCAVQAENYNGLPILYAEDYREAVSMADAAAVEGDVVLLSPASTSFDRFANFMERGKVFKELVNDLK